MADVSLFLRQRSRRDKTSNVLPCRYPVRKETRGDDGDRGKCTLLLLFEVEIDDCAAVVELAGR